MLGFDPWYRGWTTEEGRLVLNALLYPKGASIPSGSTRTGSAATARASLQVHAKQLTPAQLPQIANRPVKPSGSDQADVIITVNLKAAAQLKQDAKNASLPKAIATKVRYTHTKNTFTMWVMNIRTDDQEARNGWESPLMGQIAKSQIKVLLAQL
jgi:hypothetical protein